ncbi:MAG: response regulator [Lachnospiraceae bacterium]|nr:response regulator [Lachnospiraceae bacterium]
MYSVYLVDDDSWILEELIEIVPWLDYAFEVIGSSTDPLRAVEEIEKLAPDVVFCDLKMPNMDGNELIKTLKEKGVTSEFVMLSAYDSFENVRAFFQQTGFDYLLKPVNNADIQIVLEGLDARLSKRAPLKDENEKDSLTENPGFNKIISYINDHYDEKITLNTLAKQFGFSKGYICGLFQKYFNKSLNLYLTEKRMELAKELLLDKSILVKDVAYRTGYADYYHFFKVFKNHYGISPKELRES